MPADIFQFLTDSDRKLLFDGARKATYERGAVLFHEGAPQPNLYVVRGGLVRVDRNYQGQGIAVARYGPGQVLGEVAFLTQQTARGSALAEEDAEVDVLEGGHIQAMLASDSGLASRFYHSLALCLGERLVQITPGVQLPESFGSAAARPRLQRTGQLSERQFPPELVEAVADLQTVAATITEGRLETPNDQAQLDRACDTLAERLNQFTTEDALVAIGMDDLLAFRDGPSLARGLGTYAFRETFPLFMLSATIAQAYEKPRGQVEDLDLLGRIERPEPEGDGRLGLLIDRWFLGRPLCRSRRNTLRRLTALLVEMAGISRPSPVSVTSLAAGTAQEVFDLLRAATQPVTVTCIDRDPDTLRINAERARLQPGGDRIAFLQANLLAIISGEAAPSLGVQQIIYGTGVCDYLNDEQVVALLKWVHDQLAPAGWVVLTNRDSASPDRAFAEQILDWPITHRTSEEFRELFARSPFGSEHLAIETEEAGVNLLARSRKD